MQRTCAALCFALAMCASAGLWAAGPVDQDGRPLVKKLGTVDVDKVEESPVVFKGKLYRCEWVRSEGYSQFVDCETGVASPPFARKWAFTNAFVEGDTVYVTCSAAGPKVQMFVSKDLKNWDSYTAVDSPKHHFFNTSICKAGDQYVMMLEIDRPVEEAGVPFTARFATSKDLKTWTWTPPECAYAKDRYTAPHLLRYLDGYYYNFYLEDLGGSWEQCVARSKDLVRWEKSPLCPVLRSSAEDRKIANPKLGPLARQRIAKAKNVNNSDIDFCEYQGRLVIFYSWGDQSGTEHLAQAVYEGSEADFLRGWFPEGKPTAAEAARRHAARLDWWQDARFGMFIHWGPVSIKGTEIGWSRGDQIPIAEYDALYKQFNPEKFNADQWVGIAKQAGMKYMVFTTKHHDGFCMFDTKQTDHNVMRSPFGRDVVKELAEACRRQGLAFGTYHSVCDWHHPDFPLGSPGGNRRKPQPNLDRYEKYLRAQIGELIGNYGPLLTMWFDVPQEFDAKRGAGVVEYVRSLQPDILVNNRCSVPADFDTPEQEVGKVQFDRPWETCMTICQQWAWKPNDKMKSLEECIHTLVFCAGGGGNLLFNVGPMPNGEIEARQIERLKEIGQWLQQNGESIYGTRGGPFITTKTIASTRKASTIYVHWFKAGDKDVLSLPVLPKKVLSARVLGGGAAEVKQEEGRLAVKIAPEDRREIDTIVVLELDGSAMDMKPIKIR